MFIHLSKKGSFKNFLFWIFVILNILDIIQKFQPLVFTYSHIKVVYSKSSNWSFSSTNIFVTNIWFFFKELLFCMSLKFYIFLAPKDLWKGNEHFFFIFSNLVLFVDWWDILCSFKFLFKVYNSYFYLCFYFNCGDLYKSSWRIFTAENICMEDHLKLRLQSL